MSQEYVYTYGGTSLTLQVTSSMDTNIPPLGYYVIFTVQMADGIRPEIFVHDNANVGSAGEQVLKRRFLCVTKPSDLETYPANEPAEDNDGVPPFYRRSSATIVFDSPGQAEEAISLILLHVSQLVRAVSELGIYEEE